MAASAGQEENDLKETRGFFWFLLPSILLLAFAVAIPFFSGLNIAFTDWDGISKEYSYIGLQNFVQIFRDKNIITSIRVTLLFAIGYTLLNNVLSLLIAILLKQKFKGNGVIKTVFFVPMALSAVLAAFVWGFIDRNIFSEFFGNSMLGNPDTVIIGIIIISLWCGIGSNIMVYLAGLTNIPGDYYEAAAIDGATGWAAFKNITLPLLGPSFTMCITLTLTSALREFGVTMSATGGGPARSSEMISIFIYKNLFSYQKAGYGQAVALLFMVILMALGIGLTRFFRSKEVEM